MNVRRSAIVGAVALLSGCSAIDTADYYWQGASGQMDILARAKPIAEVIADSPDPASDRLAWNCRSASKPGS